ncbi:virulence factor TspB C-terminal domain-related protein [Acinetobacter bohemicus]|uniref:virulence factor TspB C-terminal domain-related protein n=1 Tax=Acinetobacter bohemicus TaxID=1435036 RepID=UPI0040437B4E
MKFFKYLFALCITLISIHAYSACEPDVYATFKSNLADPPYSICSTGGTYQGQSMGKCLFNVDSMNKTSSGFDIFAHSTGATCENITVLVGTDEPEPEQPTVLPCTADSCLNPNNLRCPTGYVRGSFNGQNLCVKNNNPDPEPEPECPEEGCKDESEEEIINAIDNANNEITDSVNNLGSGLEQLFNDIKDLLQEISNKISALANNGNNGGNEDGNDGKDVDTSPLEADLPYKQLEKQTLDENIFSSNAQCPEDRILNLPFVGTSFTYTFKFYEICNGLNIMSYFIMIAAYLLSIYILVSKT